MGDLSKYEEFLENFESFAERVNVDLSMQNEELYVPEYTFEDSEFFKSDQEFTPMKQKELNYGRISDYQLLVFNDGIDIFGTAENSNYFLTDQTTTMEKTRIFNTNVGEGDAPSIMGDNEDEEGLNSIEDINKSLEDEEKEIQEARIKEQQEKFESLGPDGRPSTEELNNLNAEIQKREETRREYTEQTGLINDFDVEGVDNRNNNFGRAGEISSVKIWGTLALIMIALFQ